MSRIFKRGGYTTPLGRYPHHLLLSPWVHFLGCLQNLTQSSGRGPDRPGVVLEARAVAAALTLPEAALGVATTIVGVTAGLVRP